MINGAACEHFHGGTVVTVPSSTTTNGGNTYSKLKSVSIYNTVGAAKLAAPIIGHDAMSTLFCVHI